MATRPRVSIVSPALADANNGNWFTASRWQQFLAPVAEVRISKTWDGAPVHALIALHARRSADSIERFSAAHPRAPLALVLTGTDLYRDIRTDASAKHALQCASQIVVLQDEGLKSVPQDQRPKARVIVQSAPRIVARAAARAAIEFVAVGHLRDEKDPATLMAAVQLLPAGTALRVLHIGAALDPALGELARATAAACSAYRWLGARPHASARRYIAQARALVHTSRIEGGANVVIEAVRSGVPVLASRIDGNVGLLGAGYAGFFEVGDAPALARLMQRAATDDAFLARLRAQCAQREARFAPDTERRAVRQLLADMLALHAVPAAETMRVSRPRSPRPERTP